MPESSPQPNGESALVVPTPIPPPMSPSAASGLEPKDKAVADPQEMKPGPTDAAARPLTRYPAERG